MPLIMPSNFSVANEMGTQIKTALVVEGGAMRSIFSAGVLDGFLNKQFNPFDFYIGVSAGAYNLTTFLAGRIGASLQTLLSFALNKRFISYIRFIRGGHLLDLDWIFETTLKNLNIDFDEVYLHRKPFYICVTDVATGEALYINTNAQNLIHVMKASTALPLIYRDFPLVNGHAMTDGGVADGIPVAEAIRLGAKRIMVIRARARTYLKKDSLGHRWIRWKFRHYTRLNATMRERVGKHKKTIQLIRHPPKGIEILEVCPPDSLTLGRFNRRRDDLIQGYEAGMDASVIAMDDWNKMVSRT